MNIVNIKTTETGRLGGSFYLAIAYIIVEYMRPQSMYDTLAELPVAQIAVIGIVILFLIEGKRFVNSNVQNFLLFTYLCWLMASSLLAYRPALAWQSLYDFTKWVIIYFLLINIVNERRKLYLFVVVFLLLNFKSALFAVRIWVSNGFYTDPRGLHEGGGIGAGFFKNPNDFGAALNSVFGIGFYMISADAGKIIKWIKMRFFHLTNSVVVALAILSTSSRGAALGLGAAALGIWSKSRRKLIGAIILCMVAITFIALIPQDNWERFQSIGSDKDTSGLERRALWRSAIKMANDHPVFGVGPNNFVYVNRFHYGSVMGLVQHNIFLQAFSELGYPGLILLIGMIVTFFRNNRRVREILSENELKDPFLIGLSHGLDIAMVGFVANGFFITVLYYPFLWTLLVLNTALFGIVKELDFSDKKYHSLQNVA